MTLPAFRILIVGLTAAILVGCEHPGTKEQDHLSAIEERLDTLPETEQERPEGDYAEDQEGGVDNWYPDNIAPPVGMKYPCALTPLPLTLRGIPSADRTYVNHVFSMVLKLAQSKLVLLQSLYTKSEMPRVAADYERANRKAHDSISNERVPAGLGAFHASLLRAIELSLQWEQEAVQTRSQNGSFKRLIGFPSGRSASSELVSAWKVLAERYPRMTQDVAHSLNQHLCAIDPLKFP